MPVATTPMPLGKRIRVAPMAGFFAASAALRRVASAPALAASWAVAAVITPALTATCSGLLISVGPPCTGGTKSDALGGAPHAGAAAPAARASDRTNDFT